MDKSRLEGLTLKDLLIGAAEAPPLSRMEFRDMIASHGVAALPGLVRLAREPGLAGFAIRTIVRIAEADRPKALEALRQVDRSALAAVHLQDLEAALADLGPAARTRPSASSEQPHPVLPALQVGRRYRRSDLHDVLGGSRRRGISYPAGGHLVMLFARSGKHAEYGYEDRWTGSDSYAYYGEWNGPGDMTSTGGNAVIVDRSPNILLFTGVGSLHEFRGRFAYERTEQIRTSRDGRLDMALVFHLRRVANRVEV